MNFRILGPLEVRSGGAPVPVSRARERRLLAVLLLSANRVVPLAEVIDAIWDDPPASATRQVRNCVSALRRRLAADEVPARLVADGPGYRFRVDRDQLDALVFRDLVERARGLPPPRRAEAAHLLRAALDLWRGPALAGIGGRVAQAGAAGLDESRLAAHELCVDLELELGRHRELVGELTEAVAVHPLRERLVGQLMVALHHSGRRADALQAYHLLRVRLADELGLDPSEPLQRLHTELLRDRPPGPVTAAAPPGPAADVVAHGATAAAPSVAPPRTTPPTTPPTPTVAVTGTVPRQLPAGTAHFTGRQRQLRELDRLAARTATAPAAVVGVVTGPPGVGKTALAVHWAHAAAGRFPDGQLFVNLRGFDPAGPPMAPGEAVRTMLDAVGVPPDRVPASLPAQTALYRSLLAGRRLLVLLDNARDAEQVRPLLPGGSGCLVVVTSRDRLAGLVAIEGAHPLPMDVLSGPEARQLLAGRLGRGRVAAEPRAVAEIVEMCCGLPLALAVVAARAATDAGFPLRAVAGALRDSADLLGELGGGEAALDMRSVFSWSYRTLPAGSARLFRLLGLAPGPDVGEPAAASLAGLPAADTRRLLAELVRANLVAEHAPGRYLLHDLLRGYAAGLAAEQDSAAEQRAARHRILDHYLHTAAAAAAALDRQQERVALDPCAPGAVPERLPAAAGAALAWLAAEHQVLLAAVDQAARHGFDRHTWLLTWTLADYFDRHGHWLNRLERRQTALAATQRLGDRTAQAHAHRYLARAYAWLDRYGEAEVHLQQALDLDGELGDRSGQARTEMVLGWVLGQQGRNRDALRHTEQALALYRTTGDRTGQARALNGAGWYHAQLGADEQALACCQQALALFRELADPFGQAHTLDSLGYAHHRLGQHAEAAACYRRAHALYVDLGDRYYQGFVLLHAGDSHRAAGEPDAAQAAWLDALTILDELGHPDAERARSRLREPAGAGP